MSVPRVVVFVCLVSVLLAAAGWASAGPVNDQIAAAVALPDGASVVLDAVYVESVMGGSASVRDTWAHSQSLLVFTDAAVQASWTVKVTGQMATIDGQRVLIADSMQLYAMTDGSPAPPVPASMLAVMPGVSLVDIPALLAQRGVGIPMNTLETIEEFGGSIGSAKRVGGTVTLEGKVVTGAFYQPNGQTVSSFYIQEPVLAGNGIKVISPSSSPVSVHLGDVVDVVGTVVDSNVAECYVSASSVTVTGYMQLPKPIGFAQRQAVSKDFGHQSGLYGDTTVTTPVKGSLMSLVGTRVRIWGKLKSQNDDGTVCFIDDGTTLRSRFAGVTVDGKCVGIRVVRSSLAPPITTDANHFAIVDGVLGAEYDDDGTPTTGLPVPVVRVSDANQGGTIKRLPDGASVVGLQGILTAVFDSYFYVEDAARIAGIRVSKSGHGLTADNIGDTVVVDGTLGTMTSNGERVIQASAIAPTLVDENILMPLSLTNKTLGGGAFGYNPTTGAGQKGVTGGTGWNNIGLLVRTCGTVKEVDTNAIRISDGSKNPDVTVDVQLPAGVDSSAYIGLHVMVSGISSLYLDGTNTRPLILARDSADIDVVDVGEPGELTVGAGTNQIAPPLVPFDPDPCEVFWLTSAALDSSHANLTRYDSLSLGPVTWSGDGSSFGNMVVGIGYQFTLGTSMTDDPSQGRTIHYDGYPNGLPVDSQPTDFVVTLPGNQSDTGDSGGDQLIGTPFATTVPAYEDAGSVRTWYIFFTDGRQLLNWGDAVTAGWVDHTMRVTTTNDQQQIINGNSISCVSGDCTMQPGRGYWLTTYRDNLAMVVDCVPAITPTPYQNVVIKRSVTGTLTAYSTASAPSVDPNCSIHGESIVTLCPLFPADFAFICSSDTVGDGPYTTTYKLIARMSLDPVHTTDAVLLTQTYTWDESCPPFTYNESFDYLFGVEIVAERRWSVWGTVPLDNSEIWQAYTQDGSPYGMAPLGYECYYVPTSITVTISWARKTMQYNLDPSAYLTALRYGITDSSVILSTCRDSYQGYLDKAMELATAVQHGIAPVGSGSEYIYWDGSGTPETSSCYSLLDKSSNTLHCYYDGAGGVWGLGDRVTFDIACPAYTAKYHGVFRNMGPTGNPLALTVAVGEGGSALIGSSDSSGNVNLSKSYNGRWSCLNRNRYGPDVDDIGLQGHTPENDPTPTHMHCSQWGAESAYPMDLLDRGGIVTLDNNSLSDFPFGAAPGGEDGWLSFADNRLEMDVPTLSWPGALRFDVPNSKTVVTLNSASGWYAQGMSSSNISVANENLTVTVPSGAGSVSISKDFDNNASFAGGRMIDLGYISDDSGGIEMSIGDKSWDVTPITHVVDVFRPKGLSATGADTTQTTYGQTTVPGAWGIRKAGVIKFANLKAGHYVFKKLSLTRKRKADGGGISVYIFGGSFVGSGAGDGRMGDLTPEIGGNGNSYLNRNGVVIVDGVIAAELYDMRHVYTSGTTPRWDHNPIPIHCVNPPPGSDNSIYPNNTYPTKSVHPLQSWQSGTREACYLVPGVYGGYRGASIPWHARASSVTLPYRESDKADFDISKRMMGAIRVQVLHRDGTPAANTDVTLRKYRTALSTTAFETPTVLQTDANGVVTFCNLPQPTTDLFTIEDVLSDNRVDVSRLIGGRSYIGYSIGLPQYGDNEVKSPIFTNVTDQAPNGQYTRLTLQTLGDHHEIASKVGGVVVDYCYEIEVNGVSTSRLCTRNRSLTFVSLVVE